MFWEMGEVLERIGIQRVLERCWNELERIDYPEEWSQGEAATPSRTPSPETIIEDKMMGGKLWMKVEQLALSIFYNTYEDGPHIPHPYMPRLGTFWMRSTEEIIKNIIVKIISWVGPPPEGPSCGRLIS